MIKRILCQIASICLVLLMFNGCSNLIENSENIRTSIDAHSSTVYAMDTVMELTVYGSEDILEKSENLIYELESEFSAMDTESDIYNVNHNGGGVVSSDTGELLKLALSLCERSEGALDISIYPVVQAWGFTSGENRIPSETELKELLQLVDYKAVRVDDNNNVTLVPGMEIDLGSVAKGYTGNRLVELLSENGVTNAVLNLGGNVHVIGTKPDGEAWRVAVTDPVGGGYAGMVEVVDKAVITSGGYERFFEQDGVRYHHIIDPTTGYPANNDFLSVTVVGSNGAVCDALSTALFVMGPDRATEFWKESNDFEAVFITSEGICITEGLEDVFSPLGDYQNKQVTVLYRD